MPSAVAESPPETSLAALTGTASQPSFEDLFARFGAPIFNYANCLLDDRGDAEDAAQEVFLKAYRSLSSGERIANPKAWLYRVTTCTCRDRLRQRARRVAGGPADDRVADRGDGFVQAEVAALVDQTLRRLGERHRQALILRDMQGLRHDEIAFVLGVTPGAAQAVVARARAAFQREFTRLALGAKAKVSPAGGDDAMSLGDLFGLVPLLALPPGLAALPQALGASAAGSAGAGSGLASATSGGLLAKIGGGVVAKAVVTALVVSTVVAGAGTGTRVARHHAARAAERAPARTGQIAPVAVTMAGSSFGDAAPAPDARGVRDRTGTSGGRQGHGAAQAQHGDGQTGGQDGQDAATQGDEAGPSTTTDQGASGGQQGEATSPDQATGANAGDGSVGGDSSADGTGEQGSDQSD